MNKLIIIIFIILIIVICYLILKSNLDKKEKYQGTWQEELQKFQTLTNVLGELCDQYPKICKELSIKNPLSRTIRQDYNYLKKLNEIMNEDIEKIVRRQQQGEILENLDPEFVRITEKYSDFSRYLNILCKKYKNLCSMLRIKLPIALPITQSKEKLKYYFQKLINKFSNLREMIEIFEKERLSDPNILYDWDEKDDIKTTRVKKPIFLPPIREEDEKE